VYLRSALGGSSRLALEDVELIDELGDGGAT